MTDLAPSPAKDAISNDASSTSSLASAIKEDEYYLPSVFRTIFGEDLKHSDPEMDQHLVLGYFLKNPNETPTLTTIPESKSNIDSAPENTKDVKEAKDAKDGKDKNAAVTKDTKENKEMVDAKDAKVMKPLSEELMSSSFLVERLKNLTTFNRWQFGGEFACFVLLRNKDIYGIPSYDKVESFIRQGEEKQVFQNFTVRAPENKDSVEALFVWNVPVLIRQIHKKASKDKFKDFVKMMYNPYRLFSYTKQVEMGIPILDVLKTNLSQRLVNMFRIGKYADMRDAFLPIFEGKHSRMQQRIAQEANMVSLNTFQETAEQLEAQKQKLADAKRTDEEQNKFFQHIRDELKQTDERQDQDIRQITQGIELFRPKLDELQKNIEQQLNLLPGQAKQNQLLLAQLQQSKEHLDSIQAEFKAFVERSTLLNYGLGTLSVILFGFIVFRLSRGKKQK